MYSLSLSGANLVSMRTSLFKMVALRANFLLVELKTHSVSAVFIVLAEKCSGGLSCNSCKTVASIT